MKRCHLYYIIFMLFTITFVIILSIAQIKKPKSDIYNIENHSNTEMYLIKEYEGNVAIFKNGSDLPSQVLDCKIKNLPPDAKEALATGIKVSTDDELQKYIEVYD